MKKFFIGFVLGLILVFSSFLYFDNNIENKKDKIYQQDECYQYYYSLLDDKQKESYKKIYYILKEHKDYVFINENSIEDIEKIYFSVIDDHPEFFYVESKFDYIEGFSYIIFPHYIYNKKESLYYKQQIEEKTKEIISIVKKQEEQQEKIKILYEYIIEETKYQSNKDDQNIKSIFIDHQSVCAGYARAYQYLLNQCDIDASYIGGISNENKEGHAWVMVLFNDDYYYCDPTWGDTYSYHPCLAFFMMNSQQVKQLYTPDIEIKETKKDYQYLKSIGCYMEKYSEKQLNDAIELGLNNHRDVVEIKCDSIDVYHQLKDKIEETNVLYRLLQNHHCYHDQIQYLFDDQLLLFEIYY